MATSFQELGKALSHLRRAKGLSQQEVADTSGITKAMLSAYETGATSPSMRSLARILGGLSVDLGDLHQAMELVQGKRPAARPVRGSMSRQTLEAMSDAAGALARFFRELQTDLEGGEGREP